jgi:hypothetical protein
LASQRLHFQVLALSLQLHPAARNPAHLQGSFPIQFDEKFVSCKSFAMSTIRSSLILAACHSHDCRRRRRHFTPDSASQNYGVSNELSEKVVRF